MNEKKKSSIAERIGMAVLATALIVSTTGCATKPNDTDGLSNGNEVTSTNSEISGNAENKEIHLSDDLKFLIESTDEEKIQRCEDPQAELFKNNFVAANGRSYKVIFGMELGIGMGLFAPIEMLLPEKSFYSFGELYSAFGDKLKIEFSEGKALIAEGGLDIHTEIDGKTVRFLVESEEKDYALPLSSDVIFKGVVIEGTYVTDHRGYA